MDSLGFLLGLAALILAIIALNKISASDRKFADLKLQLGRLADQLARLHSEGAAPTEPIEVVAAPEEAVPEVRAFQSTAWSGTAPEAPASAEQPVAPRQEEAAAAVSAATVFEDRTAAAAAAGLPRRDMEQAIASRWFVWIGGAAIAIGGLLFVKYAYDNELISPAMQIFLGLLAGAALVAAGEFVRRKSVRGLDMDYVPAALSAAGIVTAFGSIYAAYSLYELVGPTTAFVGLAVVALGALALSRLQGPLIAALGLIGSYVTPMMVSTPHPSAAGLFPYLFVVLVASFATMRGRPWPWLGLGVIAGSVVWTALWLAGPFTNGDTLIVGLFAHAVGLVALFGMRGRAVLDEASGSLAELKAAGLPLVMGLIGLLAEVVLLAALVIATAHGALALVFFFGSLAIVLAIAWWKPGMSLLAPLAAFAGSAVVLAWQDVSILRPAMDENGLWSWTVALGPEASRYLGVSIAAAGLLAVIGCLGSRLRHIAFHWAGAASLAPVLLVPGAWARADALLGGPAWAATALILTAGLLAGAFMGEERHAAEPEQDLASGILSVGAALLILFAAHRLFENVWLTLAIAMLAVAFAVLTTFMRVTLQASIAAAFGSLAVIRLFVSRELWRDDRPLPLGPHWVIYGYGVPAILFLVASRILRKAGHLRSAMTLEGLSLGLVISLVSLEIRVLIGGGVSEPHLTLLEMSAHIMTWLGAALGLQYRQKVYSSVIAKWGARALLAISVGAIFVLSLGGLNPLVSGDPLQGGIVFNALLLAYLAPAVLLTVIAARVEEPVRLRVRPAAGLLVLLLAFVYVTLETKRVFQGPFMVPEARTVAENYAYSAVWLVMALALFLAGLRFARQYIRYAGLGVIVIVVLKVFLWDMSSLEGLYRIASFVGLGLCLVGIGWLYQRFVQQPRTRMETSP
jgi:uncharacterized membrane protein